VVREHRVGCGDVFGAHARHGHGHESKVRRQPATPARAWCGVVGVISIGMLRGGAVNATYYVERSAGCGPVAYYVGEPEQVGRWCGGGAGALGLDGPVGAGTAAGFAGLLDGVLPDGTLVARPVIRHGPDGPVDVRRSGLDVAVSAPKSVSVLFGLADPSVATTVLAAHERAVDEALGYLERHAGHGLRGHQGGDQRATRVSTDGLVAAGFTHHTSRADDPQLHTHLVIANLVRGTDGRWSAVDSRAMHRQARTAGCIYQAVLRGELTKTLGVGWGPVSLGVAEIAGIPKALLKEFSTRRREIEAELDRTGTHGRKAAQRAAYVTRPAKSHTPEAPLRQRWADRAAQRGHPAAETIEHVTDRSRAPALPELDRVAVELFGPDGLTRNQTSFDRRDVIQALTETLPAGVPVTGRELEAAADELLTLDEAVPLLQPADRDVGRRFSTRDLLATEDWAISAAGERTALPPIKAPARAGARLSAEQGRVVAGLLASPDLVDVVVGPAGSGKTAALRTAADAWRDEQVPVIGCSLAAITARRLESATRVPCSSIARLLTDLERTDHVTGRPAGLAPRSVVLVDEASMVGTRQLTQLLSHVQAARGKLILVGDPAQLSEVEAGGLFTALTRTREPLSLTGNQRQVEDWERTALSQLRDGHTDAALHSYLAQDRIHLEPTATRARERLAIDYLTHRIRNPDPYAAIALASTRRDTTALNTAIREQLRAAGRLGPDTTDSGHDDRGYATGDVVIVTRNDHPRGLLNGTRATLTRATGRELSLRTETGLDVTVPATWAAEHLDHGYAMTVHKAQGLTTDIALLYGTAALCQQSGYVAMSRGRQANHLYTSHSSLVADRTGPHVAPPRFKLLGPDPTDVASRLARQLRTTRRHTLARDQVPEYRYGLPHRSLARERKRDRDFGRAR
jgi:conjugative relaxase-like TrwC/TraI family protein